MRCADDDLPPAKFLLVKGRAGLGNRMLGALTGILYARLTRRRLAVDWRDELYSSDGSNVFGRYFRCAEAGSLDEIPNTDSVTPAIWRGRLDDSVTALEQHAAHLGDVEFRRRSSVDLMRLDHEEQVAVMWLTLSQVLVLTSRHTHAFDALGGQPAYELLRRSLRDDLVLQSEIRERVDEFERSEFGETTIGVHVRFSDRRVDLETIRRRLAAVVRREPAARIFLSTDNAEVKALFEQAYPRVVTAPHWYPPAGTPAHRHRDCPDRSRNGVDALVDLNLLADCDYLIGDTTSSFARVAVLLSRAPSARITDVNRGAQFRRRVNDALLRASPRLAHETGRAYDRLTARRSG
jgi:hypothetical protein